MPLSPAWHTYSQPCCDSLQGLKSLCTWHAVDDCLHAKTLALVRNQYACCHVLGTQSLHGLGSKYMTGRDWLIRQDPSLGPA